MKTTTQHTPGPWIANGCSIYTAKIWLNGQATGDRYLACSAPIGQEDMPSDEDLANARLIAAAPKLLDICKRLLTASECLESHIRSAGSDPLPALNAVARALIANAEGRA